METEVRAVHFSGLLTKLNPAASLAEKSIEPLECAESTVGVAELFAGATLSN
jgi:hypothetical protein